MPLEGGTIPFCRPNYDGFNLVYNRQHHGTYMDKATLHLIGAA